MLESNIKDVEKILKALPSCIFFKDTEGRYLFATHYWEHIGRHDPGWNIRGDEFAVVLPGCTTDDAQAVIEQLYETAHTLTVADQPLSISIGVATMQSAEEDAQQTIEQADRAMYEYKQKHHAYLKDRYERP